jgi:hypothetical protein
LPVYGDLPIGEVPIDDGLGDAAEVGLDPLSLCAQPIDEDAW